MYNRFATVDPGFNTAITDWNNFQVITITPPPVYYFTVPGRIRGEEKLHFAWVQFQGIITRINPDICYIEDTALWQENLTSLTSGSSGDLLTLTNLIGGYCSICYFLGIRYEKISAESWKGQMNKDAVKKRVLRETGWVFPNDHMTDSVGMGLSKINRWRTTK